MGDTLDPRLNPYRADLAAQKLKGSVQAKAFVKPEPFSVVKPVLDVFAGPERASLTTQLLFGETFEAYDIGPDWVWGQCLTDGYVGYVERAGLGPQAAPNLSVTSTLAHCYPEPDFKTVPSMSLPYLSGLTETSDAGDFVETNVGFVSKRHVQPVAGDFVEQAKRFLGVPYLWGGRSPLGIDCSALVQLSLQACGHSCQRDSDMQQDTLGEMVSQDAGFNRGDLLFWKGHVGIVADPDTLLHANAFAMAVSLEPLESAIARIAKSDGPITAHKRLSAPMT